MVEWLKYKKYPHIGLPLDPKQEAKTISYVKNDTCIIKHSFLPLIRRVVITKPFKRKGRQGKDRYKTRDLTYASHLDSAIYSYYADNLQKEYEKYIDANNLDNVVAAYRKTLYKTNKVSKCNIDVANEVFEFVKKQLAKHKQVAVITFDIKGFFDNLDHKYLKERWEKILGYDRMPDALYTVFKNVTNYKFIYENEIFDMFKDRIICKGSKIKKIYDIKHLKNKGAIAFCYAKDLKDEKVKHLINKRSKDDIAGIPQGLPISAVLANVYMSAFDKFVSSKIDNETEMYVRYSDDIIIVCPIEKALEWKKFIKTRIEGTKLSIQPDKTDLYHLTDKNGKIQCDVCRDNEREPKTIEYLGFSFDGKRALIKNASVCKYYSKMRRGVHFTRIMAINIKNKTRWKIFERRLIDRYSFSGSHRHKLREWNTDPKTGKKIFVPKKINGKYIYSWGNFITYVRKASKKMNNDAILKQVKGCHRIMHKLVIKAKRVVNSAKWKWINNNFDI